MKWEVTLVALQRMSQAVCEGVVYVCGVCVCMWCVYVSVCARASVCV